MTSTLGTGGSSNILSSERRASNIDSMYALLLEQGFEMQLDRLVVALHAQALDGWDLTKLHRYQKSDSDGKDRLENARAGEYRDDCDFGYTSMETSGYFYVAPSSRDIPTLLSALSSKFEDLVQQKDATDNPHLLAAWAMTYLTILHPFYEGNGRVARALLPYTLLRLGFNPQYVENRNKQTIQGLEASVIQEIEFLYDLGGIYPEQMKNGGILEALSYAAELPPTRESINQYQDKLSAALMARIQNITWEDMMGACTLQSGADILKSMPIALE